MTMIAPDPHPRRHRQPRRRVRRAVPVAWRTLALHGDGGRLVPRRAAAVFATVCSTSPGCHSAADKQLGLDLQSPEVASRLIGVHGRWGARGCSSTPSNPAMSVMYTKLTASPPFGARMPFGQTPLDDATIACVLQWITVQVTDGGAGEGGDDGGVEDGSAEASSDDGSPVEDSSSPPPDDARHGGRAASASAAARRRDPEAGRRHADEGCAAAEGRMRRRFANARHPPPR